MGADRQLLDGARVDRSVLRVQAGRGERLGPGAIPIASLARIETARGAFDGHIRTCLDGGGAEIPPLAEGDPESCVFDPRMEDGLSLTLAFASA